MIWYALASLAPAAILAIACVLGGVWAWAALAGVTIGVFLIDRTTGRDLAALPHAGGAHMLVGVLAVSHFVLLALAVIVLPTWFARDIPVALALGAALGLFFGQVSNALAHELIHRSGRWLSRLGTAIYVSLLFGHHASAHRLVHHVWVASPNDPNSARLGEGFYRFWPRA